MIFYFIWF